MNKIIRIMLIAVALIAILAIAGGSGVWASPAAKAPQVISVSGNPAPLEARHLGSADGWNCGGVNVNPSQKKGVCSVATVLAGNNASVWAVAFGNKGTDFKNGVVSVTFKSGNLATICFAANPPIGNIYFQPVNSSTWVTIPFSFRKGQACATISENGLYAFGN